MIKYLISCALCFDPRADWGSTLGAYSHRRAQPYQQCESRSKFSQVSSPKGRTCGRVVTAGCAGTPSGGAFRSASNEGCQGSETVKTASTLATPDEALSAMRVGPSAAVRWGQTPEFGAAGLRSTAREPGCDPPGLHQRRNSGQGCRLSLLRRAGARRPKRVVPGPLLTWQTKDTRGHPFALVVRFNQFERIL